MVVDGGGVIIWVASSPRAGGTVVSGLMSRLTHVVPPSAYLPNHHPPSEIPMAW